MASELQHEEGVRPKYFFARCDPVAKSPFANMVRRRLPSLTRAMIALAMVMSSGVGVGLSLMRGCWISRIFAIKASTMLVFVEHEVVTFAPRALAVIKVAERLTHHRALHMIIKEAFRHRCLLWSP